MIRFVLQKIKNKKWLTTCLLLGLVFLVAAVSCQPMFKAGSLNKMLLDSFHNAGEEAEAYPTVIWQRCLTTEESSEYLPKSPGA